jgi:hypothetical protein
MSVGWVKVFLSYLVMIKESLYAWWDVTIDDASMTPQIIYLERYLNFRFESTEIYIDEGYTLGPWVFNSYPGDPTFFMDTPDDSWVYSGSDASEVDFVVHIPETLASSIPHIASIVHKYKLPGKNFIIQKDA